MKVKRIIAVTTISTVAYANLAGAQSTSSQIAQPMSIYGNILSLFKGNEKHARHRNKMENKLNHRKAVENAIVSGDYQNFKTIASTTPLKDLSEESFKALVPEFQAKKQAEEHIRSILSQAGVKKP